MRTEADWNPATWNPNPIDCVDGKWGFWDETWSIFYDGYDDKEAAEAGLKGYIEKYLK